MLGRGKYTGKANLLISLSKNSCESSLHWSQSHSLIPMQRNYPEFSLPIYYDINRGVVENSVVAKIIGRKNISKERIRENV